MRKVSVSVLASLDGVIQDPGGFGEIEHGGWGNRYFSPDAQQIALKRLQASDYFLVGRVTYELLYKAWANIKTGAYLERMREIPKLVASNTLSGSLPWNATVIKGDPAAEVARLRQETGGDIEVYGSANLLQYLLRRNLVDEFRISVHPIVLGSGTRLFPDGSVGAKLRLVSTQTLESGVADLYYEVAEEG